MLFVPRYYISILFTLCMYYIVHFSALHSVFKTISQFTQTPTSYGKSCWWSRSSQVQVYHLWQGFQIQASFKGMQHIMNMALNFYRYKTFVIFKSVTFENFQIFLQIIGSVALLWHNEKGLALSESAKKQVWLKMLKIA